MRYVYAALFMLISATPAHAAPIALETPDGTIRGTLLTPDDSGPYPVAVLLAGSGPVDRDGNARQLGLRPDCLKLLAEALAERGIATLRYDKRGVGASESAGPDESELRFDQYAEDAERWCDKLSSDDRFSRVILIGHSEGALLATLAAQNADVDQLVCIAGFGRSADEALLDQIRGKLSDQLMQRSEQIIARLKQGKTSPSVPVALMSLFRPSVQPYLISWFKYDPAEEIAKLDIPVLLIHGNRDAQVDVEESRLLHEAATNGRIEIIEGMNHVFKASAMDEAAQRETYTDASHPIVDALPEAIGDFILSGPKP